MGDQPLLSGRKIIDRGDVQFRRFTDSNGIFGGGIEMSCQWLIWSIMDNWSTLCCFNGIKKGTP